MATLSSNGNERPCPLCGQALYPWILAPATEASTSVGLPIDPSAGAERVLERCESCGAALERGHSAELVTEWRAVIASRPDGATEPRVPNRASLQAGLGVEGWAAIDRSPGALLLTPRSLELLAERNGARGARVRTPLGRRPQAWMWQTLLNGLTFHPNFAREVRAGRLRPATARGRVRFWLDAVATVLAAPLVALVSVPLELVATFLRRGGELAIEVRATEPARDPA